MSVIIWHNPRCNSSRKTLALLEERGIDPVVRPYLTDPPSLEELRAAHALLGGPVIDMMRPREAAFAAEGLGPNTPDDTLFAAMVRHPILIQRPVVFANGRATIGRPPETVLDLL